MQRIELIESMRKTLIRMMAVAASCDMPDVADAIGNADAVLTRSHTEELVNNALSTSGARDHAVATNGPTPGIKLGDELLAALQKREPAVRTIQLIGFRPTGTHT